MATRTGIAQIDLVMEEFAAASIPNHDELDDDRGDTYGPDGEMLWVGGKPPMMRIADFDENHDYAEGRCQTASLGFIDFCLQRGLHAEERNTDEETIEGDQISAIYADAPDFGGWHCVVLVRSNEGHEFLIDWTNTQYKALRSEWPLVMERGPSGTWLNPHQATRPILDQSLPALAPNSSPAPLSRD